MTYGFIGRSGTRPFNLALNTILAYKYEYNGGINFYLFIIFFSDEFKKKKNQWCLYLRCLLYIYIYVCVCVCVCIFHYKLNLGSRICKVMVVKSDGHIMIDYL